MALPKPGTAVRGSRSGRPIMVLLDLLGRRWVLRILWELRDAPLSFRALREQCDAMSPTVLNQRLRELREADIVVLEEPSGYALSRQGRQLLEALMPLQRWSEQWQKRLAKAAE
ncbi:MAG TPA: helix-turn-helix domain-containing protein [Noviherbaspirillum sp.]|uniref:winged helix-turn-helix transcriptional regulator n=1 Tax=Noviherbaspirillum sp. TaxID=1926288 RepID=UPI002D62EE86|nr:helix-turn-helix domain-containing protein [Noviherbaspirillum sp.]HYD94836.1 helix-turn-helix domain-containing protein [Noviherbaspirillum sp.]